ncbi:signal peptidase I [Sulfurovum sp. zt1-1]|uniref:Signal peptidase I n=1 Tax=Sulfurovum zhangzhouensis TaxID=3019067 RepID=A0ABT7QY18_9BACT|nr:signal peptidase I [Sulfurovum zhangzhouensis]MDM5271720.1 signal peptidase I [Sulfurovum zhangzhouensis]
MKKVLSSAYRFSSSWTGTIIIVLFLIFFVAQSFVIPSGSMKRTQLIGDFLFAKKFSYGIPTPHLPWLEVPVLPDFNGNGHLIEGPRPQREDIVIFRKPQTPKVHFVKRCVAVGGDELLYMDKRLLIHFHDLTTEAQIKEKYPEAKILSIRGRLWAENPYMSKYPGIQYAPENFTSFEYLAMLYNNHKSLDMYPVYLEELGENAFYKKVEEDHFYMIGDNRDNSNDSRMWGSVAYKYIVGKPWLIYMSLEFRSYDEVLHGDTYGNGKDNARLSRVCGDHALESDECKTLWNNQRYTVRWGRVGRLIDTIQYEEPIE